MTYLITTTDGTVLGEIEPQTTNSTFSSLTLIGEALLNYGQYLNDDLIALTENFADTSSPVYPLAGQIWYNKLSKVLNYYDGLGWDIIASQAWVQTNSANYASSSALNAALTTIANIVTSDGLLSTGLKPNYQSNNYILNTDSLLAAIGKLDTALALSGSDSSYLTIGAAAAEYAPLISPALSGVPTAPTAAVSANSAQIATTAYAQNLVSLNVANVLAVMNGEGYAKLASPAFTGTPTAPTQAYTNNSTAIATTNFVQQLCAQTLNSSISDLAGYLTAATAQSEYAPIVSPNFVGAPTAPTQGIGNYSSLLATTAFVANAISNGYSYSYQYSGYLKLPDGFFIQWGELQSGGGEAVTFPIAFPNYCLNVAATIKGTPGSFEDVVHVALATNTYFDLYTGQVSSNALAGGIAVYWFAVGY